MQWWHLQGLYSHLARWPRRGGGGVPRRRWWGCRPTARWGAPCSPRTRRSQPSWRSPARTWSSASATPEMSERGDCGVFIQVMWVQFLKFRNCEFQFLKRNQFRCSINKREILLVACGIWPFYFSVQILISTLFQDSDMYTIYFNG